MEHHKFTVSEIATLIDALSPQGAQAVIDSKEAVEVKFGNRSLGWYEALLNKLGEENAQALLECEKSITWHDVVRTLVDKNGCVIPSRVLKNSYCNPNPDFYRRQPEINYFERLARQKEFFPEGAGFLSAEEFEEQSRLLLDQISKDKLIKNLLKGVFLPVCFPHLKITKRNYGQISDEVFLIAAGHSYESQFSDRGWKFYNHRKGTLKGEVEIVEGSRHDQLIKKMAQGPVPGIYFPNPMQGFSVLASREQLNFLPETLLLSGVIDAATAMVAYPDVLARDYKTPGLDLAAVSWRSAGHSLCFKAHVDSLDFPGCGPLGHARDYYSGALLFLG